MKNKKIITIFLGILFLFNINHVKAETAPIVIVGKTSVLLEEEQTAIVKLATEQKVGVIRAKIEYSSQINDITLKGLNGWTVIYNPDTKEFTLWKAEGAQEETIMEIIYTTGTTEGKAQIVLSDIQMTTINYETIQVPSEVVKEVEVKSEETEEDDDTNPDLDEEDDGDEDDGEDNTNPDDKQDGDKKDDNLDNDKDNNSDKSDNKEEDRNLESNEKNGIDKNNQPKEDDNTIKKSILPKTGLVQKIFLIAGPILAIATIACYRTYKKYKGI